MWPLDLGDLSTSHMHDAAVISWFCISGLAALLLPLLYVSPGYQQLYGITHFLLSTGKEVYEGPGRQLHFHGCAGAPQWQPASACRDWDGGGGPCCTINWSWGGGLNKGGRAAFTVFPRQQQQQQLTGKCYLEYGEWPLHQQTANVNAGAVSQVYNQQTEGPHQRLSLKDNSPPPLLLLLLHLLLPLWSLPPQHTAPLHPPWDKYTAPLCSL